MNQKRNYQKELETVIQKEQKEGRTPKLLLHSCCAPCSSYVLEYLSPFFAITDFFYNPNISPKEEYQKREEELKRLIDEMPMKNKPVFLAGEYHPEEFYQMAKGLEDVPEGGERCFLWYRMRLEEAAKMAVEKYCDYFATTLTISPLKNAQKLNEIGEELEKKYGVRHLPSDFKKKNGYKRSIELSKEYDLYRQDFCGCVFSKRERDRREQEKSLAPQNR